MWLKKAKYRKFNKNTKEYFPNNQKVYQCYTVWRALQHIALSTVGSVTPKDRWLLLKLPVNEYIHDKSRILKIFFCHIILEAAYRIYCRGESLRSNKLGNLNTKLCHT